MSNSLLSSFRSPSLSSTLKEVQFLQYTRTYSGGYQFNFADILGGCNDLKTKNFSNFYLTSNKKISDSITTNPKDIKTDGFLTTFQFGEQFLTFNPIDPTPYSIENRINEVGNYGAYGFSDEQTDSAQFTIVLKGDNLCHIIFSKNFIDYYLASDEENELFFAKKKILNFDPSTTNSQDFKYAFSQDRQFLLLFQNKASGGYQIVRNGNDLVMVPVGSGDLSSAITNYIKLDKNLYINPYPNLNTSFITYNNDNNLIDEDKSKFDMTNNVLLHRPYSKNSKIDLIVLKNQLAQSDIFSCGNTLLSAPLPVDNLRNYTSIFEDIREEKSEDLELNYVFYNKFFKISPGTNYFTSPSSMYPFEKLNINDSKFVDCGSFAFPTPELADKVYKIDTEANNSMNGQHYLCTWLSGGPSTSEKIWVDRYYYPDLITKQEALTGKPLFSVTYQEALEALIQGNTQLKDSINTTKIFDKRSDLTFSPNENFIYERLDKVSIAQKPEVVEFCSCSNTVPTTNYFKTLNKAGQFTFGFYFLGDNVPWVVESNRNNINGGVRFTKSASTITCSFNLYNSSVGNYLQFEVSKDFKFLKENFVYVSIDTVNGKLYFYLNNGIIGQWEFPLAQFNNKNILFGDFYYIQDGDIVNKKDVMKSSLTNIFDVILSPSYMDESIAFYLQLLNGKINIQDIEISLPCGMRNSNDNINILNSVCSSSIFKSGKFDLKVKNINSDDTRILDIVEDTIRTNIRNEMPPASELNNIQFENYK